MKVFGSEPENLKHRTPLQTQRRMVVLAMRVLREHPYDGEAVESLKMLCAQERLVYDSYRCEQALRRAARMVV